MRHRPNQRFEELACTIDQSAYRLVRSGRPPRGSSAPGGAGAKVRRMRRARAFLALLVLAAAVSGCATGAPATSPYPTLPAEIPADMAKAITVAETRADEV